MTQQGTSPPGPNGSGSATGSIVDVLSSVPSSGAVRRHIGDALGVHLEVRRLLDTELRAWTDDFPEGAAEAARELIEAGGKRLRPILTLASAAAVGGAPQDGLPVAVAVELLHTGTLLHDDVIDHGELRRGLPTARVKYGNAVAVVAGDFCFFAALENLIGLDDVQILTRAMKVARGLAQGELIQLRRRRELERMNVAEYLEVIERKTGVLFEFATYGGARLGGAGKALQAAMGRYGHGLGVAFQIVDDILDFSAERAQLGKSIGQDLARGVPTMPLIFAFEADPDLEDEVAACVDVAAPNRPNSLERMQAIIERVVASDALDRSRAHAREVTAEAIEALDGLPASKTRDGLVALAQGLLDRVT